MSNISQLENVLDLFAGNLNLLDRPLTGSISAEGNLCVVHRLGQWLDTAFHSHDFSAFDHAVLPIPGRHGHWFEDEHVIRSFNYVLDVVHTGLEQAIPYSHLFREPHHSFRTNEKMIGVLCKRLIECSESDYQRDGYGDEFDLVFHDFFLFLFLKLISCLASTI